MRTRLAATALLIATSTLAGAGLQQLGLEDRAAKAAVLDALDTGSVPLYPVNQKFKPAAAAARAAMTSAGLLWAKSYTQTPEFAAAYAKLREERKPQPITANAEMQRQLAELETTKKEIAALPPEQRRAAEELLKNAEAQLRSPERQQAMKEAAAADQESHKEDYDAAMKDWQTRYPADPRQLIAWRLHQFLDLSESVDFDAKLVPAGGRMQFANAEYEHKSSDWKLCYRAGREAVAAARIFANSWLAEISPRR
jgi:hypothetical protein